MDFPETPFWDFSLALYGRDGVAPACLILQDRHQIDVNILLFCIWLGADGYPAATEADIARYRAAVAAWHEEAVRGLRAVRRWMKPERPPVNPELAQALRARLQKLEIDAEHLEQVTLFNCIRTESQDRPPSEQIGAAAANVRLYFRELGIATQDDDLPALRAILSGAFPSLDDSVVASALDRAHLS